MIEVIESKAEFARRLGIKRQSLQRHASVAGFPLTTDGRVRVEAALEWLTQNVAARAKAPATAKGGAVGKSLIDAKTELLEVQIARGRVALDRETSATIPYADARRALAAFVRLERDTFLQFAVRHGPAIAAEVGCDEDELIRILSFHLRQALNEAADNPKPFLDSVQPAEGLSK